MTEERLRELLQPFLDPPGSVTESPSESVPEELYAQLSRYLDLLVRWNERTNLTAIREPEEMVTRHFGESLFTALHLRRYLAAESTLLDIGSGAGFPGLPIQLAIPALAVTLAESQGKKAAFLREAVRTLDLPTEVWAARVEAMPARRLFHVVTLRAVDSMADAIAVGWKRLLPGGLLAELSSQSAIGDGVQADLILSAAIPESRNRVLRLWKPRRQ